MKWLTKVFYSFSLHYLFTLFR